MLHLLSILLIIGSLAGCRSTPKPSPAAQAAMAFDELRSQIRSDVTDTARREQLIGLADELEGLASDASQDRTELGDRLKILNRNHASIAEDFEAVFAEMNTRRSARHQRLLDIFDESRSSMSDDEWRSLNSFKVMALEAALVTSFSTEVIP